MGIQQDETVAAVLRERRRRQHRAETLNQIEIIIQEMQGKQTEEDDQGLWRTRSGKYKPKFSSRETWQLIRTEQNRVSWSKAIWFKHGTPKYVFITWLAIKNRLSTGDRMRG